MISGFRSENLIGLPTVRYLPRALWSTSTMVPLARSEGSFAKLCGVAPLEASSGRVRRHRLNRGGDRQANHALWRIVFTRMNSDERTRKYVARRLAEGLTTREVMRVLKRYVARELYPHLVRTYKIWSDGPGPRTA